MAPREEADREETSRLLMRELRSAQNTRFLRAMPGFRVDGDTPDRFAMLLERMERQESGGAGGSGGASFGAVHNSER